MTRAELERELFGRGVGAPLVEAAISGWLARSRRFAAFVEENLPKVRKKLRTARDEQSALDVLLELQTAYRLLSVKAHGLVYEPLAGAKEKGPDFAVTYNGKAWFLLEATRLGPAGTEVVGPRLARAVAGKLRQFQPSSPNVLLIGVEDDVPGEVVDRALVDLARRAETADREFFDRLALHDRGAFFRYYERLALVVVTSVMVTDTGTVAVWANPRCRHPLGGRGRSTMLEALAALG